MAWKPIGYDTASGARGNPTGAMLFDNGIQVTNIKDSTGSVNALVITDTTGVVTTVDDLFVGADLDVSGNGQVDGNLTVTGNFTVNGTTNTLNTTNTVISDNLIELNNGLLNTNPNDSGIVIERGSSGDNAFMGWDESADKFILGTTTATGASTGDLTITQGTLLADLEGDVTGDLTGNADTATTLATGRTIALSGDITATGVSFDGSQNISLTTVIAAGSLEYAMIDSGILDNEAGIVGGGSTTKIANTQEISNAIVSMASSVNVELNVHATVGYSDGTLVIPNGANETKTADAPAKTAWMASASATANDPSFTAYKVGQIVSISDVTSAAVDGEVFMHTNGSMTMTAPSGTGDIVTSLGTIVDDTTSSMKLCWNPVYRYTA